MLLSVLHGLDPTCRWGILLLSTTAAAAVTAAASVARRRGIARRSGVGGATATVVVVGAAVRVGVVVRSIAAFGQYRELPRRVTPQTCRGRG